MLKPSIACVFLVLLFASASTQSVLSSTKTRAIVRTIHVDQPKPNDSRYYYVPFEVAPSTQKLHISYSYDRGNGTNTLDLGLFDPRFTNVADDLSGFRGWSGGRRSEIFISKTLATPGYLPGAIQPGTWRIILGLYQVAPAGVDVTLTIETETDDKEMTSMSSGASSSEIDKAKSPSSKLAKSEAVAAAKASMTMPRWVTGDLHMHTIHSDGDWTVPQLVTSALAAGLDFICITDHNTNSHHADIEQVNSGGKNVLVMRGEEITTYGGHTNAWGLPKNVLIDFRVQPRDQTAIARVVTQVHKSGALISINHPFGVCGGCMWSYGKEAEGFDAIEVWNGPWDAADELAVGFWDRLLQQGRRITAVASSDSHRAESPLGQAASHVAIKGTLSAASVLGSIREGRVYLTSKPTTPTITFEARTKDSRVPYVIGDVIRLNNTVGLYFKITVASLPSPATISLISDGRVVRTFQSATGGISQDAEVTVSRTTYFRIEARDESGAMLTLTNPIYVQTRH